jgi:hypothetical protein
MRTDWRPDGLWGSTPDLPEGEARRGLMLDLSRAHAGRNQNGKPELLPYRWRPGEAEREAAFEARLAALRAEAARRAGLDVSEVTG